MAPYVPCAPALTHRVAPVTIALILFLVLSAGCARDSRVVKRVMPPISQARPCDEEIAVTPVPQPEPPQPKPSEPEPAPAGAVQCRWPLECPPQRISSRFGHTRRGGRTHKGVDMESPRGTPVVATAAGMVTFSGRRGAYGNIIVIDHGSEYETAYAHLDSCLLKKGAPVHEGQVIGHVGRTGNATAYHLHYEVRHKGVRVNPEPWLPTGMLSTR